VCSPASAVTALLQDRRRPQHSHSHPRSVSGRPRASFPGCLPATLRQCRPWHRAAV
jgi:hypothetical protein